MAVVFSYKDKLSEQLLLNSRLSNVSVTASVSKGSPILYFLIIMTSEIIQFSKVYILNII